MSALRWHPQKDDILSLLDRKNVRHFYHFTSVRNLPGIAELRALCSKEQLELDFRWPPPEPGGNQLSHGLDRVKGNWDYVALNFTPHTPMAFHRKQELHLCFIVIDKQVAALEGVIFTNANATKSMHQRDQGLDGLNLVNFDVFHTHPRPGDRDGWVRPVQAEAMVPGQIPLSLIRGVAFVSDASLQEGIRQWGDSDRPPFRKHSRFFANSPLGIEVFNFPFAYDVSVFAAVNPVDLDADVPPIETYFSRALVDQIAVMGHANILAGTSIRVDWSGGSGNRNRPSPHEFMASGEYAHYDIIPLSALPDGPTTIRYLINERIWCELPIVVSS